MAWKRCLVGKKVSRKSSSLYSAGLVVPRLPANIATETLWLILPQKPQEELGYSGFLKEVVQDVMYLEDFEKMKLLSKNCHKKTFNPLSIGQRG